MEIFIQLFVGLVLLVLGYFIGVKQKISLVHSYHYKNVTEGDKTAFCKGVGIGNAIIGGAILSGLVLRPLLGQTAAFTIVGIAAVVAGVIVISTILRYNHTLF